MAAVRLDPLPRNFQQHGFWRHRTEGEIFWMIKHGSPGTALIGFGEQLTDDEIWSIIQYERTFSGEHGHGMMVYEQGIELGEGWAVWSIVGRKAGWPAVTDKLGSSMRSSGEEVIGRPLRPPAALCCSSPLTSRKGGNDAGHCGAQAMPVR